jgi:hypothetical protein
MTLNPPAHLPKKNPLQAHFASGEHDYLQTCLGRKKFPEILLSQLKEVVLSSYALKPPAYVSLKLVPYGHLGKMFSGISVISLLVL